MTHSQTWAVWITCKCKKQTPPPKIFFFFFLNLKSNPMAWLWHVITVLRNGNTCVKNLQDLSLFWSCRFKQFSYNTSITEKNDIKTTQKNYHLCITGETCFENKQKIIFIIVHHCFLTLRPPTLYIQPLTGQHQIDPFARALVYMTTWVIELLSNIERASGETV